MFVKRGEKQHVGLLDSDNCNFDKTFFDVLLRMDAVMEIITKRLLNGWEIYKSTFWS
jgi:hypothetical protein